MGVTDKLLKAAGGLMDFIPQMVDAAQARGAQIIDMLTSGRAGEITDEMLDLGDPVANTRLNEYLFRNYDLPMNEASRMQRAGEMGQSQDYFKGMYPYDPDSVPVRNYKGEIIEGADRVPRELTTVDRPSLYPTFNKADPSELGWKLAGFMARDPEVANNFAAWGDAAVYPLKVNLGRQYVHDAGGGKAAFTHFFGEGRPFRDAMRSGEYDSGVILNTADEGSIAAILRPENIRSRFARFDPRLAHLRNLSAGVAGGVPLGLMSMTTNEERR